jgi:hypothetical protein
LIPIEGEATGQDVVVTDEGVVLDHPSMVEPSCLFVNSVLGLDPGDFLFSDLLFRSMRLSQREVLLSLILHNNLLSRKHLSLRGLSVIEIGECGHVSRRVSNPLVFKCRHRLIGAALLVLLFLAR